MTVVTRIYLSVGWLAETVDEGFVAFGKRLQEARLKRGLSQEDLAERAGLHRTAVGLIESGEREPLLFNAVALSDALAVPLADLIKPRIPRRATGEPSAAPNSDLIDVTPQDIVRAIEDTYLVLDLIDAEVSARGWARLAQLLELANLSAVVGNIFGGALAKQSQGRWVRNGPHKYPDLIRPPGVHPDGIEIKVALEDNNPKGHLPKPGRHLLLRYVLAHSQSGRAWKRGERGDTVVVWEVRAGVLTQEDFQVSNTPGDSGKSAVVGSKSLKRLRVEYLDRAFFPGANQQRYVSNSRF